MPRPRAGEPTRLGRAVKAHRGPRSLAAVGGELGVTFSTLSRVERGAHEPSYDTAVALARWLGWSVEQVIDAARTPVPPPADAP